MTREGADDWQVVVVVQATALQRLHLKNKIKKESTGLSTGPKQFQRLESRCNGLPHTAMEKKRIVRIAFGTVRQKMVLE